MTVIENTASNIIIENFYPILNVVAEVEELKCLFLKSKKVAIPLFWFRRLDCRTSDTAE